MILDTRKMNSRFSEPAYAQLATASAWSTIKVGDGVDLNMAQADVDNAFYRIGLAPGMREHSALPAVHRDSLIAALGGLRYSTWCYDITCIVTSPKGAGLAFSLLPAALGAARARRWLPWRFVFPRPPRGPDFGQSLTRHPDLCG